PVYLFLREFSLQDSRGGSCGGELDYLGEVSAEQLELVSSALKVIRTERVKKACTKCDCIVEAPAPSRPIERGIAGPG
ncbi:IS66 family transposase zinc-finger binding domain-containing protein, partial [Escherichia coli]